MLNTSLKKTPNPEQEPNIRNQNFLEVSSGYNEEMAVNEAKRCMNCMNSPCVSGCPVKVQIPSFIRKVAEGDYAAAYQLISETNGLPAVCGRVCPQENQCEGKCVRGIKGEPVAIGNLERFCADFAMRKNYHSISQKKSNGIRVAVVGSGPSGLTCASDLAKKGYKVTVFEAFHTAGGVLIYGIPEFRLPKEIVHKEIEKLEALGVEIRTNMVIGKTLDIDELFEDGFKACFIGTGAGLPNFMKIPGEALIGVYSANEYLTRINLMKAYKSNYATPIIKSSRVAVVGGGNVAMDAARCAKRLGAEEVFIVYRRSMEEMPARKEEVRHAIEEGIQFLCLKNPIRFIGNEKERVCAMECVEMELGKPDTDGRRIPVEKQGSNFTIDVDTVIIAVGTSPNPLIRTTTKGIEANKKGCLIVDEATLETSRENVYAGGDAVTGAATIILAMGAGKKAAAAIDKKLSGRDNTIINKQITNEKS